MCNEQLDWNKWRQTEQLELEKINEVRSVTLKKYRLMFCFPSIYVLFTIFDIILKFNYNWIGYRMILLLLPLLLLLLS